MGLIAFNSHFGQRPVYSNVQKSPVRFGKVSPTLTQRPVMILQNAGEKGTRPAARSAEYLIVGNLETSTPDHPTAIALPLGHGVAVAYRDANGQGPIQAVQSFKNTKKPVHFVLSPAPDSDLRPHAQSAKSILNLLA